MKNDLSTKEKVLYLLEKRNLSFVSGQEIADELYLTRAAVWKAIKALREQGFNIEAVSNRGYRLVMKKDVLSKACIDKELESLSGRPDTYIFDEIESTNDYARKLALEGKEEALIIADSQSKGRGRRGRDFFSPKGSGLYMSFLLRPEMETKEATKITCMAAVALVRAIKKVCNLDVGIKWVNDIFYAGKKVAGILTEGFTSLEDNELMYVVVGIGINMYMPAEGFPAAIKDTAGVLFAEGENYPNLRNELCAQLVKEFYSIMYEEDKNIYVEEYRNKSILIGSYVKINSVGKEKAAEYAKVIGIDDECRLIVEKENGKEERLSTGEVSVVKY